MNNAYKSADEIMREPFAPLRMEVSEKFFAKKLTMADFTELGTRILQVAQLIPDISIPNLGTEIKKAYEFLKTGKCEIYPDIKDSAQQCIWGMALACSECDPQIRARWQEPEKHQPIYKLEVWDKLKRSAPAISELRRHAFMVAEMPFLKEDVELKWGACQYPNVGFYFDPQNNKINLDLVWALIGGFEHSRAAQLHEIGHSRGTLKFTRKLDELKKTYDELNEKARKRTITKEEYKQLKNVSREYQYRFSIFDEAENSYANRFAVNASDYGMVRQDIGYDLNSIETQLFSVGTDILVNRREFKLPQDTPANRAYNFKRALRLSFYVNNDIVEDDAKGWQDLGVNVDWIEYTDDNGNEIKGVEALKKLRKMATHLEELQLSERDYHKPEKQIIKLFEDYSQKRCDVIDEIFERFAKRYYDQTNDKEREKDEQNSQNGQQGQQSQQGGQSQDGQSQGGQGQSNNQQNREEQGGPENENGGQGNQELNDDENDSRRGKNNSGDHSDLSETDHEDDKEGNGKKSDKEHGDLPGVGEDDDRSGEDSQSNKKKPRPRAGSDEEKAEFMENFDGQISDDNLTPENMVPLEDLPETPEEIYQQMIAAIMEGIEDGEGMDATDIIRLSPEKEQENCEKEYSEDNSDHKRQESSKHQKVKSDSAAVSYELPKNLVKENEFQKIIGKHQETIEKLRNKFIELQNKYYDYVPDQDVLAAIPDAGNLRVDIPSYIERLKKQAMGEELKEKDFENYIVSSEAREETKAPIDVVILIDNSGSMTYDNMDKTAIEIGCCLFQATRDNPAFNVYVEMMHEPVTWIARPGENSVEISRRLATVMKDRYYGDDKIGACIKDTIKEIGKRDPTSGHEGMVNFFMITDGGHTDGEKSFELVENIVKSDLPVTFNWVLTESYRNSYVENMIDEHSTGTGGKRIDYVEYVNGKNVLEKLVPMIEKRVEDAMHISAQKTSDKKMDLNNFMEKKGRGDYDG